MRALVTGASGFSGRHLIEYLRGQGAAVHPVPKGTDVTSSVALAAVVEAARPDSVFHLAGIAAGSDVAAYYRVNVTYAATLLQALTMAGFHETPVLFVGTAAEYGMISPADLPVREEAPARPYNHYGASKLAQTLLGATAGREKRRVVVARTFNLLGPGMPPHLAAESFARQITAILRGEQEPVIAVGNLASTRDFIDVRDAVQLYVKLLANPEAAGEVVNVCSGRAVSIRAVLDALIAASGRPIEVRVDPARVKALDLPEHYGSTEKLERLAGPVPAPNLGEIAAAMLRGSW